MPMIIESSLGPVARAQSAMAREPCVRLPATQHANRSRMENFTLSKAHALTSSTVTLWVVCTMRPARSEARSWLLRVHRSEVNECASLAHLGGGSDDAQSDTEIGPGHLQHVADHPAVRCRVPPAPRCTARHPGTPDRRRGGRCSSSKTVPRPESIVQVNDSFRHSGQIGAIGNLM